MRKIMNNESLWIDIESMIKSNFPVAYDIHSKEMNIRNAKINSKFHIVFNCISFISKIRRNTINKSKNKRVWYRSNWELKKIKIYLIFMQFYKLKLN